MFVCNQCHFKAHLTNTQHTPFALPSCFFFSFSFFLPPPPTSPQAHGIAGVERRSRGVAAVHRTGTGAYLLSTEHPAPRAQCTELLGLGFLAAVLCRVAHCLLFTNTNTPTPLAARSLPLPQRRLYFQIPPARPTAHGRTGGPSAISRARSESLAAARRFFRSARGVHICKELTGCQGSWSWCLALHTQDAGVSPHG